MLFSALSFLSSPPESDEQVEDLWDEKSYQSRQSFTRVISLVGESLTGAFWVLNWFDCLRTSAQSVQVLPLSNFMGLTAPRKLNEYFSRNLKKGRNSGRERRSVISWSAWGKWGKIIRGEAVEMSSSLNLGLPLMLQTNQHAEMHPHPFQISLLHLPPAKENCSHIISPPSVSLLGKFVILNLCSFFNVPIIFLIPN